MSSLDTPSISPMEKHGIIEIDAFCTGCFYNLHGQVVAIDDRLGFPVCRCPECGKYHPAGTGVTAAGVWVRRFAIILLFSWISIVIASLMVVAGAMAGFDAASIGMYEHGYMAAPDGRPVNWSGAGVAGYVIEGTNIVVRNPVYMRELYPWNPDSTQPGPGLTGMSLLTSASLLLGLIAGILCVTLLWHWPRHRYFYSVIVALIPASLISIPFTTSIEYVHLRDQCIERSSTQVGFQCLGILLGIMFGRAISRGIIQSIIPPKPRQALAFLWLVDGKNPPSAAAGKPRV
jgi:hypothetical protein